MPWVAWLLPGMMVRTMGGSLSLIFKDLVLGIKFQGALNKVNYLDPFQSGFRPRYGMETVFIIFWIISSIGRMEVAY